ncbi:MAG: hypothetical protein IJB85_11965 [Clostridia bacterium]|nr:hypothetical protein [Clostridia bacterium]
MRKYKAAASVFSLLLAALALFLFRIPGAGHGGAPAPKEAVPVRDRHAAQPSHTLFPTLDESAVSAITVVTSDRSFYFLCEDPQLVSVNGQHADAGVFRTLLEQIADLPVDPRSAFSPQAEQLLLTLTVSAGPAQHTARFYADGKSGETTRIVSGPPDAPQYRQTSGWRVGTLMMTCEGTRILDALGNETPIAK